MKKINNPDVNNVKPEYWEKVLASHGLGIDQPLTDNSDDMGITHSPGTIKDDFRFLRQSFDGDDRFMNAHEIKKARVSNRDRIIPEWTQNDQCVREILRTVFPKLQSSELQKKRAGRWTRFIYFYYRLRLPPSIITKEMGMTVKAMEMLILTLNRVSRGLTRHGKPRKGRVSVHPTREPGERGNE